MATAFTGLETARQALMASQTAMQITNQNIANASTDGYTRQRLTLESVGPDIGGSKFNPPSSSVGQGVEMTGVQQIRNTFLDSRYRAQNSNKGMYDDLQTDLLQVEDIFNEFSDSSSDDLTGLSGQITSLLNNISKLQSAGGNDPNLAKSVKTSVDTICSTVKSDYNQLTSLRSQLEGTLKIDIDGGKSSASDGGGGVNAIIKSISVLNTQIANYETSGQGANELRDQRNKLLDQLSGYFDINVTEQDGGMVTINLAGDDPKDPATKMLIDKSNTVSTLEVNSSSTGIYWYDASKTEADWTPANITGGTSGAALQIINGDGVSGHSYPDLGVPAMQNMLDSFSKGFTAAINKVFQDSTGSTQTLMTDNSAAGAAGMSVSADWGADPSLIYSAYSGSDKTDYIAKYTSMFDQKNQISGYDGTIQDYTDSISECLADRISYVKTQAKLCDSSVSSLTTQRKAVSGVDINEEGVNIIKYQQAYNAAARVITVINDMLETLIKQTGV